jgi:hypothetical protein
MGAERNARDDLPQVQIEVVGCGEETAYLKRTACARERPSGPRPVSTATVQRPTDLAQLSPNNRGQEEGAVLRPPRGGESAATT